MKKILSLNCLIISTFLLASCDKSNKIEQDNKSKNTKDESKTKMTKEVVRQKTDSGLEYEIVKEGTGISPKPGQQVTVHYTGWLDNNGELGTKFDSSVDRGEPFSFKIGLGYVIAGWDEGVLGMKVGEKRRLIIPSQLGYGARGAGRIIPANAKLIFDVELLEVK